MVFDILLGIIVGILGFVISLFGDFTGHTADFSILGQAFDFISWFIVPELLVAWATSFVFWVGAFTLYAPIRWVITKIPGVSD